MKLMLIKFSPFGQRQYRLAAFFALAALAACSERAPPLPALKIDPSRVTVSGISSGAYMAHQVHIAWSTRIAGAGLIAGGPYGCAAGQLDRALKLCTRATESGPDIAPLVRNTIARTSEKSIDPLQGLAEDRVWIFHGDADTTVAAQVSAAIAPFYQALSDKAQVHNVTRAGVAHTFPTAQPGGDCGQSQSPYLGNCRFDAAGEIFRHVVLIAGEPESNAHGVVVPFDQDAFLVEGADARMSNTGYVYIPEQCRMAECGVHLAFHGCLQSAENIGMEFVEHAGYNRWADLAGVVVIYPQTRASLMPLNPKACWDWWGYTGSNYDTQHGAQIAWVGRVLDQLGVHAP